MTDTPTPRLGGREPEPEPEGWLIEAVDLALEVVRWLDGPRTGAPPPVPYNAIESLARLVVAQGSATRPVANLQANAPSNFLVVEQFDGGGRREFSMGRGAMRAAAAMSAGRVVSVSAAVGPPPENPRPERTMTRADPAGIVILDPAAIEASAGYPPRPAVKVLADGSRRPLRLDDVSALDARAIVAPHESSWPAWSRVEIAAWLNALPFVRWDRFVESDEDVVVYGWIAREGTHADFVLVRFAGDGSLSCWTSSSAYSTEISRLIGAAHAECQRVEAGFDGLVGGVVRELRGVDVDLEPLE